MIRASIHTPDREGYMVDFAVLPRVGERLRLVFGGEDDNLQLWDVERIEHILMANFADFTAGAQSIEIHLRRVRPSRPIAP